MLTFRVGRLAIIAMCLLSTSVNISNEPHVFRTKNTRTYGKAFTGGKFVRTMLN